MPLQEVVSGWDQQPQEAVEIDTSDTGPIAVVLPQGGAPAIYSRHFAESFAAPTGTNIAVRPGAIGLGAGSVAQNTNVYRLHSVANQTTTVWERPSSAVTVLAYVIRTGNAAGTAPIFGNQSPSTSPFSAWSILDVSGTGTASFECSPGGSTRSAIASVSIPNNVPTALIGRYNGTNVQLFQNGVSVGSTTGSGNLVYPNDATSRGPGLGNFWNFTASNRAFVGQVYVAAIWERALSDTEIASISANPWQIFQRREWVPMAAASGGGVTGASSGTLQLVGSAAGSVLVSGASAGTLAISGTSTAAALVTGASTGTLSLSGTATGTVGATGVTGQSSQTLSLTGTAAGSVRVSGASAGTLSLTGTATGNTTGAVAGASAGVLSLSGSATGSVRVSGGSAAVLQITGNAGAQIVVRGVSAGVLSMTGSATGTTGGAEPAPTSALAKYTITARDRKTAIQAKARRMEIKA